jgi:RNA polymerase sigma factor (sigma-70 family)
VQQVYLVAFDKLAEFRTEASIATWLTRIAVNEALRRLRRRRPSLELTVLDAPPRTNAHLIPFPLMPTHTDPELGAALKQIRQLIEQAIDELPDGFRAVFVMRNIEAMSVAETADVLALSPAAVKMRLYRARRLVRRPLRRRSLSTNDGNGAGQARPATRPRRLRPSAGGEHDRRGPTSGKGSMRCGTFPSARRLYAKGIVMPGDRCSSWCGPWVFDCRRPPQKRHLHAAVAQHRHGELESRRANRPIPCPSAFAAAKGRARDAGNAQGQPQCRARISNSHRLGAAVAHRGGAQAMMPAAVDAVHTLDATGAR